MGEQRNHADVWNEFARELKSLRAETRTDESYACDIAARPVETGDKAGLDRIEGPDEHNGNCRGRRLRGECCGRRQRRDHVYLSGHEFGCKCGQSIVLAFCQARLNHNVPTRDVARFAQSLAERRDPLGGHGRRRAAEKSDHRHRRLGPSDRGYLGGREEVLSH
jgi:hypothetical protein